MSDQFNFKEFYTHTHTHTNERCNGYSSSYLMPVSKDCTWLAATHIHQALEQHTNCGEQDVTQDIRNIYRHQIKIKVQT